MKCPVCKDPDLVMSERQGVEIDYCPTCRGVWLDRGELDKIVEKSMESMTGRIPSAAYPSGDFYHEDHHDRDEHDKHSGHRGRRRSWLGDLFD